MSQTALRDDYYTPIFNQLARERSYSVGNLYTPFDTTPPSMRVLSVVQPVKAIATPHEEKLVAELDAVSDDVRLNTALLPMHFAGHPAMASDADTVSDEVLISKPLWPNYNQQLEEMSAKAQEAVSPISVKDRRASISIVGTPHHFPTKAEKEAALSVTDEGLVIPPMPTERPKLSLIKTVGEMKAPTREERLGLDQRKTNVVVPLFEKSMPNSDASHEDFMAWAEKMAPVIANRTHEDIMNTEGFVDVTALAHEAVEKGRRASLIAEFENPTPFLDSVMKESDTELRVSVNASLRAGLSVAGRMDHKILSGLHAAAERVRRIGMDPQDAKEFDATFGGKYMQAPVEYVGSDTVEMALPFKE